MTEPIQLLDVTNIVILCCAYLASLLIIGHALGDDGEDYEAKRDD